MVINFRIITHSLTEYVLLCILVSPGPEFSSLILTNYVIVSRFAILKSIELSYHRHLS